MIVYINRSRTENAMTYSPGDEVTYYGGLPCTEAGHHHGTVQAVGDDTPGDQVLTVEFEDCGPGCTLADHLPHRVQDILGSELPQAR
jgi:hypothetical protein